MSDAKWKCRSCKKTEYTITEVIRDGAIEIRKCNDCETRTQYELTQEERAMTFKCKECGIAPFKKEGGLLRHIAKKHGKKTETRAPVPENATGEHSERVKLLRLDASHHKNMADRYEKAADALEGKSGDV